MNAPTLNAGGPKTQPGNIALGLGRTLPESKVYKILFTCKKGGMDYLGQVKIDTQQETVEVEVFNENYFDQFVEESSSVLQLLEKKVLSLFLKKDALPESFQEFAANRIESLNEDESSEYVEAEPVPADARDLNAMFDRLNQEYFAGRLEAGIEWGRETRTVNRRSFRFGSWDEKKNLIRIHPRLRQEFVPIYVLELTVYHEMCHIEHPPVRRNGQWQSHHRDFKKKEKEYRHFRDAMKWEKNHWAKLLAPSAAPVDSSEE